MANEQRGATYSSKLQCAFHAWEVVQDGELALRLPPDNCCHMSAAIEIAMQIMPACYRIYVYQGDTLDIEYRFVGGRKRWECLDYRAAILNANKVAA